MYQPTAAPGGAIRVATVDTDGSQHYLRLSVSAAQTLLTALQHALAQAKTAQHAAAADALPELQQAVLTFLAAYHATVIHATPDELDFRYQGQRFELAWDVPEDRVVLYTVPDSDSLTARTLYRVERAQWYIAANAADTGEFLILFSRMLVVRDGDYSRPL